MEQRPPASLTEAIISMSTGTPVDKLEELEELEIIFTPCQTLTGGGLERCVQLRSLYVMRTGLQHMFGLDCLGKCLTKLCLTDQNLQRIDRLDLPCLRELLLHRNRIKSISGLEGCPKLERLWLQSNRISRLENLSNLGALRELCVQDNCISRVTGLEYLGSLEVLALGQNPIADFCDLQRLAHLPALRDLSLRDNSFGECPIVRAEG